MRSLHFVHSSFSSHIKKLRAAFCGCMLSSNKHIFLIIICVTGVTDEMEVSLKIKCVQTWRVFNQKGVSQNNNLCILMTYFKKQYASAIYINGEALVRN